MYLDCAINSAVHTQMVSQYLDKLTRSSNKDVRQSHVSGSIMNKQREDWAESIGDEFLMGNCVRGLAVVVGVFAVRLRVVQGFFGNWMLLVIIIVLTRAYTRHHLLVVFSAFAFVETAFPKTIHFWTLSSVLIIFDLKLLYKQSHRTTSTSNSDGCM